MEGSKPITHALQNQAGLTCMCGFGRKNTKHAGQRSTCHHGSRQHTSEQRGTHQKHHMAGSKPITHSLKKQSGSRCMCGGGRKKTKQAGQSTCQLAGQQHTSEQRGHITSTTWRAASQSLTSCKVSRDPDACVGLGDIKQSRVVRRAHASWPASNTHLSIKGTKQAPHGGQQANHSPAVEPGGGIRRQVRGWAIENKAG